MMSDFKSAQERGGARVVKSSPWLCHSTDVIGPRSLLVVRIVRRVPFNIFSNHRVANINPVIWKKPFRVQPFGNIGLRTPETPGIRESCQYDWFKFAAPIPGGVGDSYHYNFDGTARRNLPHGLIFWSYRLSHVCAYNLWVLNNRLMPHIVQ